MADEVDQIYRDAIADPSLLSNLDIDSILEKMEDNDISEKKMSEISREIFNQLYEIQGIDVSILCSKLIGYRWIENICDLRLGRIIRWITQTKDSNKRNALTNGAILTSITIEDSGVKLLCQNNMRRFFTLYFDKCIIFQKLTLEEQIILMANDSLEKYINNI